ncbi:MAG TPA: hypothetical protein VHC47_08755 [Mucilaginibacter sp.]|nr:hypothetical protein [Mucilaginibacter sp.]
MIFIKKLICTCILAGLFSSSLCAQQVKKDTNSFVSTSIAHAVNNFNNTMGEQIRLYNGPEYLLYQHNLKGNALFPLTAQGLEPGEVHYDGYTFKNVPMMYDIYKDVVVVLLYNKFTLYTLLTERVHDFTLLGHHFIRINADSLKNNEARMETGFYDQLYSGKSELLARRIKTLQTSSGTAASLETYFLEKNEYYLKKGNTYYKVDGRGSFFKVLKDKKNLLQKYLKDNNISFRENPELAMAELAAFYDQN